MRPDAIPVTPLATHATLSPEDAQVLFGSASLRGSERVDLVRLGEPLASVAVALASRTRLETDALIAITDNARLVGPLGAVAAPEAVQVCSRLVAPAALARAWGLGETGSVVLGPLAMALPVETGAALGVHIEQSLWIGAGRPQTARWVAGLDLGITMPVTPEESAGPQSIPRRVVTENDVRQAILHRQRLALRPDQIVTPAAQSLAREHGVFA